MRLKEKIAVITGAGGIGTATAQKMAESGATVVIADLNESAAQDLAKKLRNLGLQVDGELLDVRLEKDWAALVDKIVDRYGRIDILVNNAGVAGRTGQPFDSIEFDDWRNVMSVNLDGAFLGTRSAVRAMKHTGGGAIVNIASISGFIGTRGGAAYGASKGGVHTLTKQAAYSCAKHSYNIRVNSIHPGNVWTDFIKQRSIDEYGSEEAALKALSARVPLGRIALPDDVAWAVVYLASDEARMITGAEIVIDGGTLIS